MPCTLVVLSDNNVLSRLNAPRMRISLLAAPHSKLLASDEISITGSPFVILFLEQFILLNRYLTSVIGCGDKFIITSKHPLDILSAFVLPCSKYL